VWGIHIGKVEGKTKAEEDKIADNYMALTAELTALDSDK
jgi:hypothetical protein